MNNDLFELKKEVEKLEGKTIGTLWGSCRVGKVFKDTEEDIWYVELNESGEEFVIELEEWEDVLM